MTISPLNVRLQKQSGHILINLDFLVNQNPMGLKLIGIEIHGDQTPTGLKSRGINQDVSH